MVAEKNQVELFFMFIVSIITMHLDSNLMKLDVFDEIQKVIKSAIFGVLTRNSASPTLK